MKKTSYPYHASLLLLLIVIFNSCTIHKRLHKPGYFVQWHSKKVSKDLKIANPVFEISQKQDYSEDSLLISDNNSSNEKKTILKPVEERKKELNSERHPGLETIKGGIIESENHVEIKKVINKKSKSISIYKNKKNKDKPIEGQRVHPLAVLAFILALSSILLYFPAILGVIFGSIALRKINQNSGQYKSPELARASVVISFVVLVIGLLIVGLLLLAFGDLSLLFLSIASICLLALFVASYLIINF